jgi:CTP synthase
VATQAHPEFLSRPTRAHPLFSGLVAAARERAKSLSRGSALGHAATASA